MAQQIVNVGNTASDGTGDELRDAFTKINQNFTELYSGNVQITAANIRVYTVAGRDGNVVLTVNDVAQAASKAYVNTAISTNLANVTTTQINSINANVAAANSVISNHSSRITTLESNAATQATSIDTINSTKASITYVNNLVEAALSGNAILANVAATNANVAAANAAILLRANLSGATFTGNISANNIRAANTVKADTYFIGGSESSQGLGQTWANPAALFFANTALMDPGNPYYQINLQNLNPFASGDFVVTADDGNDASNFIALGLNGSQINDPLYPWARAHTGYVYVNGGELQFNTNSNIEFIVGNIANAQIVLTTSNILKLTQNTRIQFPDGTIQTTAFGGNANLTSLNANITAANVKINTIDANLGIVSLQIDSLWSNANIQGNTLNSLLANSATQAIEINLINSNITSALSNDAIQANQITSLQSNISAANVRIQSIDANVGSISLDVINIYANNEAQQSTIANLSANAQSQQTLIINLTSNAATQQTQINLINANVTAANNQITSLANGLTAANLRIATLDANVGIQSLDILNLYSNINGYLANVSASNAAINAANANISTLFTLINIGNTSINTINSSIDSTNSNVTLKSNILNPTFSSNITANGNAIVRGSLFVGNTNAINYPGIGGLFTGNVNGYYQLVLQNNSSGSSASGDIVVTADNGTDTNYYITMGVNGSGWQGNIIYNGYDTGLPQFANDGYLETIGGNTVLRSDGNVFLVANSSIILLEKNGNLALINGNLQFSDGTVQSTAITDVPGLFANIGAYQTYANSTIYTNSNVTNYLQAVAGNIIPAANLTYTLGNVNYQWKEIYVSGNTIFMGGIPLSTSYINDYGSLSLGANSYVQFGTFVDSPENTYHDLISLRAGYDGNEASNFHFASNGAMIVGTNFRILPRDLLSSGSPEQATGNITIGNLIALSNVIGNVSYTPANTANYNSTITNIQQALDELAARIKALGG